MLYADVCRPWRVDICAHGIPRWALRALIAYVPSEHASELEPDFDSAFETVEAARQRCRTVLRHGPGPSVPRDPPDFKTLAWQVVRVDASSLSPAAFESRFVSRGIPAVLETGQAVTSAAWEHVREAIAVAMRRNGCNGQNCKDGVSRVCSTDECVAASGMSAEMVPRPFRREHTSFHDWEVFSGRASDRFGGPEHFDLGCDGSVSVQYSGIKNWSLWAPIPLQAEGARWVAPHQRFEATLGPGDMLFFPPGVTSRPLARAQTHRSPCPCRSRGRTSSAAVICTTGWFHATQIVSGESLAAVYYFKEPRPYTSIPVPAAWSRNPFGFGACNYVVDETHVGVDR